MSTVHEAVRVANHSTLPSKPVYPYSRHSYDKAPGHFYSKVSILSWENSCDVHMFNHVISQQEDLWLSHAISNLLGSAGVVIWGSTKSTDTSTLCSGLESYVSGTFGPFVKNYTEWAQQCSNVTCSGNGQCVASEIPAVEVLMGRSHIDPLKAAEIWAEYFTMAAQSGNESVFTCKCFGGWTAGDCSKPASKTSDHE